MSASYSRERLETLMYRSQKLSRAVQLRHHMHPSLGLLASLLL
jgi:hypothetical protein